MEVTMTKTKKPTAGSKSKVELGDIDVKVKPSKTKKKSTEVSTVVKFELPSTIKQSKVSKEMMSVFAQDNLLEYGEYVVKDRAVPEFRDGLKPVHRHLIYAMHKLNLHGSDFKKAARVVGDTIGKYHPHGDTACYGALVTIANTFPKLALGRGNWGSPIDNAAAQRYTEVRLADYSKMFLLDSGYLEVVPRIKNFDDSEDIPLYLPSLLPTMLLIGNEGGIAYGVRACNPSFQIEGVAKLVEIALSKGKVTDEQCVKYLKINAPFGSECVATDEELADFIKTGRAKAIRYQPKINIDYKNKIVEIVSYAPGFQSEEMVEKKRDKIRELPEVSRWVSDCGDKRPNAGPFGAYYYVVPKRGVDDEGLYQLAEKIKKILTGSQFYNLGLVVNHVDESKTKFAYVNFSTFINQWVKYRILLEQKYLENIISKRERDVWEYETQVFAVTNKDQVLEVMKKALDKDDPDTYAAKALKIERERATYIIEMKLRRLAKLELRSVQDKLKAAKADIKQWKSDLKDPNPRITAALTESVNKYVKLVNASIAETKKSVKKKKSKG